MSKKRGPYRVDPLRYKKKSPVLLNGLTEAETNATASVMGLVEQKVLEHAPCLGMNCGITRTDQMHSAECQAEHAATIAGGKFVKPAQPQQEPVAWVHLESWVTGKYWPDDCFSALPIDEWQPLYTSPPAQRTWVEVEQVKWEGNKLIAKLKEKNT